MPEFEIDLVTLIGLIIVVVFGLGGGIIGFLGLRQGSRSNIRDIISTQIAEFPSFRAAISEQISKSYREAEARIRDFATPRNEFDKLTFQLNEVREQLKIHEVRLEKLRVQFESPSAGKWRKDILGATERHNEQLETLLTTKEGIAAIEHMTRLEMLLEIEIEQAATDAVKDPSFIDKLGFDTKDNNERSKQRKKGILGWLNDKVFGGLTDKVKSVINNYLKSFSGSDPE